MIKVCIAGATGNVGSILAVEINNSQIFSLTEGISKSNAGKNLGEVINEPDIDLILRGNVEELGNKSVDVLIEYTTPSSVKRNVEIAISKGINVVIGTSGLSDSDYEEINELALQNSVGAFAAGNFSITSALMQYFAKIAAKHIGTWEIIDYAPDTKVDAPSGTARELSFELSKVKRPSWRVPIESNIGLRESRGAELNGSQIHSIRVPGFYSSSEIIFGLDGEKLTLRHDSISYKPYVQGTLLAASKVVQFTGLKRGIISLLEI
jgi:4-hydroxy-tetrahydrodipicolinate reductase